MARTALVHPYLEPGEAAQQRTGGARMIEVDVGEGEHPRRVALELGEQALEAAARAGIHDHVAGAPGADHVRTP